MVHGSEIGSLSTARLLAMMEEIAVNGYRENTGGQS